MTVQIDRRSKTHRGNGITTVFPYDFPIPDAESVRVYLFNETNNTRTDLSDAQYNITGLGEDDFGSVTYPLAGNPLPATMTLTISREVPYTQELDIHNQGGFYPEVLEDQLDLMVMQTQQVKSEAAGALRAQLGETFNRLPAKSSLAGKYLAFDGTGEPFGRADIALGSASFATEAEARAGTSTTTLMSPLRTFQAINERTHTITPEDFIADATDFGSITAGLQTFFATLAAEGGIGRLTQWYPVNGPIVVASAASPFVVEGVGRYVSGLRRAGAAEFTVLDLTCDEFVLRNFGVDGGRATFPSSGMHGIRLAGSRWSVTNVHVRDHSGIGIYGAGPTSGVETLCSVQDCHVDGTGGAQYGIALTSHVDGMISGCFVENVHSSTNNHGINLAGCSNTAIANCRVRNCFVSVHVASSAVAGVGSNNQVSDLLVASPNSSSSSGSNAVGVRLNAGSALACSGMSIDGGNQAGFIGVQIDNDPDGGAAVALRASNCAGTDSYVLKIVSTKFSLVTISSVFNVNDRFVHLVGPASTHNTILLGRKEATPIYAPWQHVQDDMHHMTNFVQLLSGDITQFAELDDDEAVSLVVIDGVFGLLEVSTSEDGFWFRGTARFSATPALFGSKGANTTLGTTALTTGTSNGADGDLNIAVTLDTLYIKNRIGDARRVLFRLTMA